MKNILAIAIITVIFTSTLPAAHAHNEQGRAAAQGQFLPRAVGRFEAAAAAQAGVEDEPGLRTRRPAMRKPSKAWGLVTSCTR